MKAKGLGFIIGEDGPQSPLFDILSYRIAGHAGDALTGHKQIANSRRTVGDYPAFDPDGLRLITPAE